MIMVGNSEIIEELLVAVAEGIPEGKEDGSWRALRRIVVFCLPMLPIAYLIVWKLGYL